MHGMNVPPMNTEPTFSQPAGRSERKELTGDETTEGHHRDDDFLLPRRKPLIHKLMRVLLGLQERGRFLGFAG